MFALATLCDTCNGETDTFLNSGLFLAEFFFVCVTVLCWSLFITKREKPLLIIPYFAYGGYVLLVAKLPQSCSCYNDSSLQIISVTNEISGLLAICLIPFTAFLYARFYLKQDK